MLIPSLRHRPEDLECWAELEAGDLAHARSAVMSRRVCDAIAAIIAFSSEPCYCSVSWGKDSTVLAYLVRQHAPQVPLVNLRCTNRNPECDLVRDDFLSRFGGDYHEIAVDYGDLHRSCRTDEELDRATNALWFEGFRRADSCFGDRYLMGLTAEESRGRKIRLRKWGLIGRRSCCPLGWWTVNDVFAFLAVNRLPVHPVYAMLGGGRWNRRHLRVAEIGDTHGRKIGRREHELEYYPEIVRRHR